MKSPQTPELSFDETLTQEGEKLLNELTEIMNHDRAEEILLNGWLHDGSLPVPSRELLSYIAARILTGSIIKTVSTLDREESAKAVVQEFRDESEETRRNSIERVRRTLQCINLLQSGKKGTYNPRAPEWQPILDAFLFPFDSDYKDHAQGVRILSRGLLEAMVLRAIFHDDIEGIEGLVSALRICRTNESPTPPQARRIAGEVIRFSPWLTKQLGRLPTKEEFKAFLKGVYPDELPQEDPNSYTAAWKLLNYLGPPKPIEKIDDYHITRLALKARSLEKS